MVSIGILALFATSHVAVTMVNWLATVLVSPHPLPRMDFAKGVPERWRTLVVVPTMLASPENIEALVEALEVRFLANRDNNLHFALLTDSLDAPQESLPGDESLLRLVAERIDALNAKYNGATNGNGVASNSISANNSSAANNNNVATSSAATKSGDRGAPDPSSGVFHLFHRPAAVESARAHLDGPRAQARKARRSEFAVARRAEGPVLPYSRRHGRAVDGEIRHHARQRYRAAARFGAPVHRRDGASSESAAFR
jgi:hypothetical protein